VNFRPSHLGGKSSWSRLPKEGYRTWCDVTPTSPSSSASTSPSHIKAQSLEAWWERFKWASQKMIKSIMGFLHYSHGLKKSLKY